MNHEKQWQEYNEFITQYNISRGMAGIEDLNTLLTHVDKLNSNDIYVEIGVAEGSSLRTVSRYRPDVKCFGIDIEERDKVKWTDNVEIIYQDSAEASKLWEHEIDLLFIDADHNFPQLALDVIGWFPHVKKEHYILFHDYELKKHGQKFDVHHLEKVFKGHRYFNTYIPSVDDNISTSMMIIQKMI